MFTFTIRVRSPSYLYNARIVGQLCQSNEWRNFKGTDREWLDLTNQLIKSCQLNPAPKNVRELLLHLGPKQVTQESRSNPIDSFFTRLKEKR